MITFRYHLVSIAAVLLALAAGVALGAGLLDDTGARLNADDDSSADPALTRFETGYAARTAPGLLRGQLDDRRVAILTLPGARDSEVGSLADDIDAAGGTVTARGELTAKLLDSGNRQFAEGVAQQAAPDVSGVGGSASSYRSVGAALARSFLSQRVGDVDDTATSVSTAFTEGDLVAWDDRPSRYADLVLVVAGAGRSSDTAEVLQELTTSFSEAGRGTVLAGPTRSSTDSGVIGAIRDSPTSDLSTVDVTDSAAGRVVATLALSEAAEGRNGAWGTARSADGAVPRG